MKLISWNVNGLRAIMGKNFMEVPIKVEYATTELCDKLMPILEGLSDWGEELMAARGLPTIAEVKEDQGGQRE